MANSEDEPPNLAELDVNLLTQAIHAQHRLHRPGRKPMGELLVRAMASFIASEYARLAAEKDERESNR